MSSKKTVTKKKASAAKKAPAKKVPAKKVPAKKAAVSKKVAAKKGPMAPRRADYGAPIDGFFAKQPPPMRAIVEALRALIDEAAPDATASLKWGMPFYALGGETLCAIAGHKSHVNLILAGPPGTFPDPDGLLQGDGKTGRHLKLRTLDELPRDAVRGWLRLAAKRAHAR